MSQELYQTSTPTGLRGAAATGRTAASTGGMPAAIARQLQPVGQYRDPFPPDAGGHRPVAWAHWRITGPGGVRSVLTRVSLVDADPTDLGAAGARRVFAHHLLLDPAEQPAGGPAWVMVQPGLLESDPADVPFESTAQMDRGRSIPVGDRPPGRCEAWEAFAGDAGWAGVLAGTAGSAGSPRVAYVIYDPAAGYDPLALIGEALALIPPARRWAVTFATHFTDPPPAGMACHWRCCVAGTPAAREARRHATSGVVLDLTRPLPAPTSDDLLVHAARTGQVPAATGDGLHLTAPADLNDPAAALAAAVEARSAAGGGGGSEAYVNFRRDELDAELARRRPLRDWLILSVLCLGLAAVISGRKLFEAIWTDRTGITFCIAVVFLIAFAKSLADVRFIDREFRLTDEQNRLLWATNNIKLFLSKSQPGIFRTHVANLATIFRRDDQIEQDNLVELMHARLRARVRPLDVASSVMVSLGLVGTIVGLIASIGGLGTAMGHAGTDPGGLMSGMNVTLGGMGTAFSATLMGSIFGGVILRLIYTSVSGQTEHLVAHIAEITEVHLLPVLRDAARERRQAAGRRPPARVAGALRVDATDPVAA